MSMSCFDCHDYMDGYNRGKKEGTIEELEKIKAEIKSHDHGYWGADAGHREDVKIIDKHITELKEQ